jgi:hypothetical protein
MFRGQKLELSLTRGGAKAGAFAYARRGKSWSFRLRGEGQKPELSLTRGGAKAGAFAYARRGKSWSFRLRGEVAKAGAFAYARRGRQKLELSLTRGYRTEIIPPST